MRQTHITVIKMTVHYSSCPVDYWKNCTRYERLGRSWSVIPVSKQSVCRRLSDKPSSKLPLLSVWPMITYVVEVQTVSSKYKNILKAFEWPAWVCNSYRYNRYSFYKRIIIIIIVVVVVVVLLIIFIAWISSWHLSSWAYIIDAWEVSSENNSVGMALHLFMLYTQSIFAILHDCFTFCW